MAELPTYKCSGARIHPNISLALTHPQSFSCLCPIPLQCGRACLQCPGSKTPGILLWDVDLFLLLLLNTWDNCTLPWYFWKKRENYIHPKSLRSWRGFFILKCPLLPLLVVRVIVAPCIAGFQPSQWFLFPRSPTRKIEKEAKRPDSRSYGHCLPLAFANFIPSCLQWHSCSTAPLSSKTKIDRSKH